MGERFSLSNQASLQERAGPSHYETLSGRSASGNKDVATETRGATPNFLQIPVLPPNPSTQPQSAVAPAWPVPLQRKLAIGAINDPLEHEADRVAEQVMHMRGGPLLDPIAGTPP